MTPVLEFAERDAELDRLVAAEVEALGVVGKRQSPRGGLAPAGATDGPARPAPSQSDELTEADLDFAYLVATWLIRRPNTPQLLERICSMVSSQGVTDTARTSAGAHPQPAAELARTEERQPNAGSAAISAPTPASEVPCSPATEPHADE